MRHTRTENRKRLEEPVQRAIASQETVTATELRKQLPRLLDGAQAGGAYLVTRRGRAIAVVLGVADYERLGGLSCASIREDVGEQAWTRTVAALGDQEQAMRWLQRPNRALGGRTPRTTIKEDGIEPVLVILGRIEHGVVG